VLALAHAQQSRASLFDSLRLMQLQVPLDEVPALPPLPRLERICGCPAAVVEAQAEAIMHVVLDVTPD